MNNRTFIFILFICATEFCCGQTNKNKAQNNNTPQTVVDLPAPYATKSTTKFSDVVGWKDAATPHAPKGFTVTKYAEDLQNPRWIYVLPNGDVLVAETKKKEKVTEKIVSTVTGMSKSHGKSEDANRITLFRDANNDGKPELKTVFLSELEMPFGMVLVKNYLYVATTDAVWKYAYKEGETSIRSKGEKIIDLPAEGRHWTRNIIANKEGSKLYVSIGSASDHAEDGIEKENRGLRNPVGMAWQPGTSTLWTAVNERDELGDDLPPDYITSVKAGGFYGWPYSYYGQHKDPRIKENEQRADLVNKAIVPDVPVGTHTASLGLAFYDKKSFPEKYYNGAFVGQHGSWNRSVLNGYKVIFVPFTNNKPGTPEDFLTGFISNEEEGKVYGRPVGVTVLKDGSLLVADDAGNTIWRVSYSK
jgi:glucose/arabinose dehydrogenase